MSACPGWGALSRSFCFYVSPSFSLTHKINIPTKLPPSLPIHTPIPLRKSRARNRARRKLSNRSYSLLHLINENLNLKLQSSKCVFISNKELIAAPSKRRAGESLHIPSCLHCTWAIYLSVRDWFVNNCYSLLCLFPFTFTEKVFFYPLLTGQDLWPTHSNS